LDFWISELQAMNIKWVKLLDDGGGSSLELCTRLLAAGIMPIVRLYRLEPNPGHIGGREEDTVRRLVAQGVRYFETNNEPNLPAEWKSGHMPSDWLDVVIDNFIYDADKIISLGGLPAFPAMGIGSEDTPMATVVQKGRADLFEKGAWIAIHNYTLNHPLDYPYDSVNQEGTPLAQDEYDRLAPWAWEGRSLEQINAWRASDKNPGATLQNDASCFLAFKLMDDLVLKRLGHKVPILSTEGGPVVGWKDDRRYPRIDPGTHAEWVVGINDFLQGGREINGWHCPDNYFTMCHWLLANYRLGFMAPGWESQGWYSDWWNSDFHLSGELPVVAAVKAMRSIAVDQAKTAVVEGRVLRADTDEPLANLAVALLAGGQDVASTATAADGSFRFDHLTPGAYDVSIAPWGVVRGGVVATPDPFVPLTIRLVGGQSSVLTGTARDAAGATLAGVHVTLQRDGTLLGETDTGADGTFSFSGLPLGTYRLSATGVVVAGIALDGWQPKTMSLTVGVAPGYRYAVIQQRLVPEGEAVDQNAFFGTVSDADGKGINGINVQMSWQGASSGTNFPITQTGKDPYKPAGRYEHIHTQGTFQLQVTQGDWPSDVADGLETAHVPGREGQPISYEVDFQLQPVGEPAQVVGAVSGAQPGRIMHLNGPGGILETQLADDGSFAFLDLSPGQYSLELADLGVITDNIALDAGMQFKQLFAMQSALTGCVLAAPDGLTAVLYAPQPWSWTRQMPLEPDGSFAFEGLPPGRYRLEIGEIVLQSLELNGENRLQLATIDLAEGCHSVVRGRVADGAGQPQSDILLTLRCNDTIVAQAHTAADGTYQFVNLPAGVYQLEVAGMGVVADNIALDGEREYIADVLWAGTGPRSVLQGRVLAGDVPVAGATVRLLLDGAEIASTQTDSNGAFRFSSLSGGLYALAVGDGDPQVSNIQVDEDATVTRDVVLPPKPAKLLESFLLFEPPAAQDSSLDVETRLALALALDYLTRTGSVGGFSLEDAAQAKQVIIVGDVVPTSVDSQLQAAGCQVSRLAGDAFALAAAFKLLSASTAQ